MVSRQSIRMIVIGTLFLAAGPSHAAEAADLERLRQTGACPNCDLSGADLSSMRLMSADLSGANLQGAILAGADVDAVDL